MRFRFLGTAAAEGWPAVFCNCPFCQEALRRGGPDIRTRSQSLVNCDLLIDFPPDTYMHKLRYGLDLSKVSYLLITHKHMDHFFPQELAMRRGEFALNKVSEDLTIYCAAEVREQFDRCNADEAYDEHLHFVILKAFVPVQAGPYTIMPLPASHMREGNEPFVYHIRDHEGKEILYLHDSGYYRKEVWDYFSTLQQPVDLVTIDSTCGYQNTRNGGHMGVEEVIRVKERFAEMGVINSHTRFFMNHFSHNGHWFYDDLVQVGMAHGMDVAYDGRVVEI